MDTIKKIWDNPVAKKAIMGLGIFILVILIIILIAACSGGKKYTYEEFEAKLIYEAQRYYDAHKDRLPSKDKDTTSLSIQTLIDNKQIRDTTEMTKNKVSCRGSVEVTNNNGYYLYTPMLDCGSNYKSSLLKDELVKDENIVTSGNGLYKTSDGYIFKGDMVNNNLIFNDISYRIMGIDNDGVIKVIDTTKRESVVWDDRYNTEKASAMGINDYFTNNLNSRIKDTLEKLYKDDEVFPSEIKAYFVTNSVCIGKMSVNDTNSNICESKLDNQVFSLLTAKDFYIPSLDPNCESNNKACMNYNYLSLIGNSWTVTGDKDSTHKVYKISGGDLELKNASSMSSYKIVAYLDKTVLFSGGDGSEANPYVIKTFVSSKK